MLNILPDDHEGNLRSVTAGQMGSVLSVSAHVVNKWAKAGKIPYLVLPSGRLMFIVPDVLERLKGANGH